MRNMATLYYLPSVEKKNSWSASVAVPLSVCKYSGVTVIYSACALLSTCLIW